MVAPWVVVGVVVTLAPGRGGRFSIRDRLGTCPPPRPGYLAAEIFWMLLAASCRSRIVVSLQRVSPQGRSVALTEKRWRSIQRHVEVSGRQDTIPSRVPAADLALALAG
jgi:hypothetical protein